MKSRAEEASRLKHLTVCHSENSQALNVKDHLPACLYSNAKSHLKINDFYNYVTSKLQFELMQYMEWEK